MKWPGSRGVVLSSAGDRCLRRETTRAPKEPYCLFNIMLPAWHPLNFKRRQWLSGAKTGGLLEMR